MKKKSIYTILVLVSFVMMLAFAGGMEQDMIGCAAGAMGMAGSLGGIWLFGKLSGVIW